MHQLRSAMAKMMLKKPASSAAKMMLKKPASSAVPAAPPKLQQLSSMTKRRSNVQVQTKAKAKAKVATMPTVASMSRQLASIERAKRDFMKVLAKSAEVFRGSLPPLSSCAKHLYVLNERGDDTLSYDFWKYEGGGLDLFMADQKLPELRRKPPSSNHKQVWKLWLREKPDDEAEDIHEAHIQKCKFVRWIDPTELTKVRRGVMLER